MKSTDEVDDANRRRHSSNSIDFTTLTVYYRLKSVKELLCESNDNIINFHHSWFNLPDDDEILKELLYCNNNVDVAFEKMLVDMLYCICDFASIDISEEFDRLKSYNFDLRKLFMYLEGHTSFTSIVSSENDVGKYHSDNLMLPNVISDYCGGDSIMKLGSKSTFELSSHLKTTLLEESLRQPDTTNDLKQDK